MEEEESKYILPDKAYDVLKWLGLIAFPAVAWFVGTCGSDLGIGNVPSVVNVLNATGALIGILIGASSLKGGGADGK